MGETSYPTGFTLNAVEELLTIILDIPHRRDIHIHLHTNLFVLSKKDSSYGRH